jgi:3-methyl-2-oxobutanoate hydroxymethyltransferase
MRQRRGPGAGRRFAGHGGAGPRFSTLPVRVDDIVYHSARVARGESRACSSPTCRSVETPRPSAPSPHRCAAARGRGNGQAGRRGPHAGDDPPRPSAMCRCARTWADAAIGAQASAGSRCRAATMPPPRNCARTRSQCRRRCGAAGAGVRAGRAGRADHRAQPDSRPSASAPGAGCDGQVLVLHDLLGLDTGHRKPRFVKDFLAEGGSVAGCDRVPTPTRCATARFPAPNTPTPDARLPSEPT